MKNTIYIPIDGTLGFVEMLNKVREHFGMIDLDHLTIETHYHNNPKSGKTEHHLVVCETDLAADKTSWQDKQHTVKALAYGMGFGATLWVHDEDIPTTREEGLRAQNASLSKIKRPSPWSIQDDEDGHDEDEFEKAMAEFGCQDLLDSLNKNGVKIDKVVLLPKT